MANKTDIQEHDDSSQQPRQTKTPAKPELSEMSKEDHAAERQQLSDEQHSDKNQSPTEKG